MAVFPGATPPAGSASASATLAAAGHTALHNNDRDEIRALAQKVGTDASTPASSTVLTGTGAGTSSWAQVNLTSMVSGVLPISNGGNGTTSTTGTGSAVFATSPTITTPTITTPVIASFASATHNHQNSAGGGTLAAAAVPNLALNTQALSNPYKFRAYSASNQTGVGDSTWTTVVLGTEDYDSNSDFASNTFTAEVAGFYHFDAQITTTVTAGLYLGMGIRLLKDGADAVSGSPSNYDNNFSYDFLFATLSDTILLDASDTIVLQGLIYLSSGTGGFTSGTGTRLSGYLVSHT